MKHVAGLALAAILTTSLGSSMTYYVLEVRGGSRIFSTDRPVRMGRQVLFHEYPGGVYMSLSAAEVEKITPLEGAPPRSGDFSPGETVFIGPALQGPNARISQEAPSPPPADMVIDSGYGASLYYWGGGYVPRPNPFPPPRPAPSNIGPNGFPVLAPPGTPGSVPPAIGPNGYPILAPPPAPRRP
jgi:hypothetical protein